MLPKARVWLVALVVVGACTCGGRTECGKNAQISLLTSIHDDPACRKLSPKGVLMYEAAKLLTEQHNNKSGGYDLELTVFDTCGSITGALKAAMKALVWADTSCLQPPFYLGVVGPDTATNAEAVHKVTSVLKVPHIVRRETSSPYLHHLAKESDTYLVQAALKIVDVLKWKSFTLVANVDEDGEDDVQHVAKKLTMEGIAKGLCIIVHDDDDTDYTSRIVHVGKPDEGFLSEPVNSTILVISEGRLEDRISRVNSTNTVLLLEDSRNEFTGLEARVEKSKWWTKDDGAGKFDAEELREVRWLEEAIKVYAKALESLCKKKKCKNPVNSVDWNNVLSSVLASHATEAQATPQSLSLSIKTKTAREMEELGRVLVRKGKAKLVWAGQNPNDDDDDDDDAEDADDDDDVDGMPKQLKKLISKEKGVKTGCATATKEIKLLHDEDDEAAQVLVSEMDDSEWWTMVCTVSGVGVAMFTVGILAVYVVYTNIRGPSAPKGKSRDISLRRTGSEREMPSRNPRPARTPQRRDSNRSIRSTISDKSV